MSNKVVTQSIEVELDDQSTLTFDVERKSYIAFMNSVNKAPYNAMHNLISSTVVKENADRLRELLTNPANVSEIAGAVIEDYKSDVSVVSKKHKSDAKK